MSDVVEDILDLATARPSEEALAIMRLSLIDWASVGLAGLNEPVSRITRELVLAEGGVPVATLFGGARVPPRAAALANGASSHALDYDDTHFAHIGHPSAAVLPAALAVAEEKGADLGTMLAAALAGCEASIRFGLLFGRSHYQTGFHQTATAGAFGATVAAAVLNGNNRSILRHALGIVSTRASGLKSQFGTMGKPYNAGIAAANGVEAAALADRGFLSSPDAISGALGFLQTHHCEEPAPQPNGFLMPQIQHKFHACCHGLHASLEALELLKPIKPETIIGISVATHPRWMSVCNKVEIKTGLETKFSYRAVIALSLAGYSTADLESYADALCQDSRLVALRERVSVAQDATLSETAASVVVKTKDGSRQATFDLTTPMEQSERAERVRSKSQTLLGAEKAEALWQAVQTQHGDLKKLIAVLNT